MFTSTAREQLGLRKPVARDEVDRRVWNLGRVEMVGDGAGDVLFHPQQFGTEGGREKKRRPRYLAWWRRTIPWVGVVPTCIPHLIPWMYLAWNLVGGAYAGRCLPEAQTRCLGVLPAANPWALRRCVVLGC